VGRHSDPVASGSPAIRVATLVIVWLAGIGAGLFALLDAAARFTTCSAHASTLACRGTGTTLGVALVLTVVAVVTTITVSTYGRHGRWVTLAGGVALVLLGGLFFAARALLETV
jgi:hypothetical protein